MADSISSVFNDAYIAEQYENFRRDPNSVEESWRQFFGGSATYEDGPAFPPAVPLTAPVAGAPPAPAAAAEPRSAPVEPAEPLASTPAAAPAAAPAAPVMPAAPSGQPDQDFARRVVGVSRYLNSIRRYGYLAVQLDPLGSPPPGAIELTPEHYGITEGDLQRVTGDALGFPHLATGREVAERLKYRYTRNLAVEFVHCGTEEERQWFRALFAAEQLTRSLTDEEKRRLLMRLSEVDGLERFLGRAFTGYKRFSIEGTDALVPMLDTAIDESAAVGARHIAISMSHRGRISVLARVMRKPIDHILSEFEGRHDHLGDVSTGDVKYHLGFESEVVTAGARAIQLSLVPNPSHLEIVNPVLQGYTRAHQRISGTPAMRNELAVVPICIHGDAAFPGEGVVAETFNLARLRAYRVGGTLHVIVNNQVGFTTDPSDGRSTLFASDLAKGFEMPVIHVNADDAEACVIAMRIAVAYRTKFGRDFLVDLVGYRRHGHNEGDEPSYTQPLLYEKIKVHPTARQLWGARLVTEGIVTQADVDAIDAGVAQRLQSLLEKSKADLDGDDAGFFEPAPPVRRPVRELAPARLIELNEALLRWPPSFTPHPRLAKQLERRRSAMGGAGGIDWGHAEALAFASILAEDTSIRFTGQDVERGTFSHRHAVLHDVTNGSTYVPLQHVGGPHAAFEIYNSSLSELAVMGFEYGYSTAAPDTLTLWEGQFGDFANVAQPVIDQFLTSDRAKWGQDSGLVLLLPHGYEGQGPEHSSARLERFLQMCAEGNMRVAYPSTPAQYYHILRRQAASASRRPLILMQPKSLLRLAQAASVVTDLSQHAFQPVVDDPRGLEKRHGVTRLVLCTGKIFYDLSAKAVPDHVTIVRVEELYPWPHAEISRVLDFYPVVKEIVWVQEEPKNMGAWTYVAPRLRGSVGNAMIIRYVGRPERASPAEGYTQAHTEEQARIVADALAPAQRTSGARLAAGVMRSV
jgi:2-oxoglutarate dehydrogenase E1 component